MFHKENIMVLRKEPRIFVRTGFTDMRKQINGLSAMVRDCVPKAPLTEPIIFSAGKPGRN
jgi:hypothetical protein